MKKNYTIASFKEVPEGLDTIQATLNMRQHPSKRNTVKLLSECTHTGDIIVHYDFLYLASRYAFFNDNTKKSMIKELAAIAEYAKQDTRIKGIVMHTDYPIATKVRDAEDVNAAIDKHYTAALWIKDSIKTGIQQDNVLFYSLEQFVKDFAAYCPHPGCKIYLENTTKVGPNGEGTVDSLLSFIRTHMYLHEYIGICIDSEHDFAITGTSASIPLAVSLKEEGIDVMVHLNTIPAEVKPCSKLDRHSQTTIFECSIHTPDFYKACTDMLDAYDISWVREVYTETMLREIEQLENGH